MQYRFFGEEKMNSDPCLKLLLFTERTCSLRIAGEIDAKESIDEKYERNSRKQVLKFLFLKIFIEC